MAGDRLTEVRRRLHRCAELAGGEERTAGLLRRELAALAPDDLVTGLGGHGLAAVFAGAAPGPTMLLRCDMDALPLADRPDLKYGSEDAAVSHKCGHDGHMAMMLGVAGTLAKARPSRGRAVLLFQPAEETGEGARRVLEDPGFAPLRPDRVLAVHNLPGFPLGAVVSRAEFFASASRGMTVVLTGSSSHAAEPQAGNSPVPAAAALVLALAAVPQHTTALHEAAQVTVVGLDVGGPAFGTSPGLGRLHATLRTHDPASMRRLAARCAELARGVAAAHGLDCVVSLHEEFPATVNDPATVAVVEAWAEGRGLPLVRPGQPFAWSEDFGHFTAACPGALFGLGAGENQPALHHPDYDFPDALIPRGIDFLAGALRLLLEGGSG